MHILWQCFNDASHNNTILSSRSEDRIRNGVKRILKSRQGATQGRLDTFFKPIATTPVAGVKRKVCTCLPSW